MAETPSPSTVHNRGHAASAPLIPCGLCHRVVHSRPRICAGFFLPSVVRMTRGRSFAEVSVVYSQRISGAFFTNTYMPEQLGAPPAAPPARSGSLWRIVPIPRPAMAGRSPSPRPSASGAWSCSPTAQGKSAWRSGRIHGAVASALPTSPEKHCSQGQEYTKQLLEKRLAPHASLAVLI